MADYINPMGLMPQDSTTPASDLNPGATAFLEARKSNEMLPFLQAANAQHQAAATEATQRASEFIAPSAIEGRKQAEQLKLQETLQKQQQLKIANQMEQLSYIYSEKQTIGKKLETMNEATPGSPAWIQARQEASDLYKKSSEGFAKTFNQPVDPQHAQLFMPDGTVNPQVQTMFDQSEKVVNTPQFKQKMSEIAATGNFKYMQGILAAGAKKDVAQIYADSRENVADTNAEARVNAGANRPKTRKSIQGTVDGRPTTLTETEPGSNVYEPAKVTGGASAERFDSAAAAAERNAIGDEAYVRLTLARLGLPTDGTKWTQEQQRKLQQEQATNHVLEEALRGAQRHSGPIPQPKPQSGSEVETAAKNAWGNYDPNTYNYRMNNGKVERAKK